MKHTEKTLYEQHRLSIVKSGGPSRQLDC